MLSFLGMLYEIQERNELQFAFQGRTTAGASTTPRSRSSRLTDMLGGVPPTGPGSQGSRHKPQGLPPQVWKGEGTALTAGC